MTPDEIREKIAEVEARLNWLENQIRMHNEIQTLDKQIESVVEEIHGLDVSIQADKEEIAELAGQKANYVAETCRRLAQEATRLLPTGMAVIKIQDDDSVVIGWNRERGFVPYSGLSGGQKVVFDMALASALLGAGKNKILVAEAAELDAENLKTFLEHVQENIPENTQVIVNTCHEVEAPEGWTSIKL